mgnify:CR=1 FL=1
MPKESGIASPSTGYSKAPQPEWKDNSSFIIFHDGKTYQLPTSHKKKLYNHHYKGKFIGKINDDDLGQKYEDGLKKEKVDYFYSKKKENLPTGTCLILITPDSERTMVTFLGTAGKISENDINVEAIKRSEILFFSSVMYYKKPSELTDSQLELLADSIKRISMRAYYQKGNTLDKEYLLSEYGNQTNFHRLRHMVFNRVGQPCIICGGLIRRDRVGNRRIDFCMNCQEPID